MNLSILHSKLFLKLLPIQIIVNTIVIILLSYTYFGVFDSENRKTPMSYIKILSKYITFSKTEIDITEYILKDKKVFDICYKRYVNDLSSFIQTVNGKVLIMYLPLGWNSDIQYQGSKLIKNTITNFNNKDVAFIDIFSKIFTDYTTYKFSESDAHLSKEANQKVADALINDYFKMYKTIPSKYSLNNTYKLDDIRCFFKPQLNIDNGHWTLRTNNQGCRMENDITLSNINDKYRIILLGDSIVVPWSVNIEDGFPSLLSAQYSNMLIINAGKNGLSTKQRIKFIEKYQDIIQPDLVILQTQLGSVTSYFYSTPWNKSSPSKEELEMEKLIYDKLKFHIFIILLINIIFFLFFSYLVRKKTKHSHKYNSNY